MLCATTATAGNRPKSLARFVQCRYICDDILNTESVACSRIANVGNSNEERRADILPRHIRIWDIGVGLLLILSSRFPTTCNSKISIRHHPSLSVSYFCFHTRSLSLRHFPSTSSTHASDYLSNSHDSHSILFSSTPILDTHLRHVILTCLRFTSQARIFRPLLEPQDTPFA